MGEYLASPNNGKSGSRVLGTKELGSRSVHGSDISLSLQLIIQGPLQLLKNATHHTTITVSTTLHRLLELYSIIPVPSGRFARYKLD